jgi:hypothetical protein
MILEIGKKEREFMEALYTLHKIPSDIPSRVDFLKRYTGFTNTSGQTSQEELCALELGLISDEIYLAK